MDVIHRRYRRRDRYPHRLQEVWRVGVVAVVCTPYNRISLSDDLPEVPGLTRYHFSGTRASITGTNMAANGAVKSTRVSQAGVSLQTGLDNPNPIRHGGMGQAERAFSAASTFLSGVMAISASQFIGAPLKYVDAKFYEAYMAWTKESFAVLMTTITQWWAPTVVRVSGDESMKGQLFQMKDGTLKCNFPHRLIMMGNHQLYTDWLYLWWIAYTNKMHGHIYIILKESLKKVPIIGWGMQYYNFIFLSRNWEQDRYKFKQHLDQLKDPTDPMWLLIFPEGTNLSASTREKSAKWAEKNGIPDMKHQLLPRSTGLQFCLQELHPSTNWLYDCTIAYEGVPKGMYGQDVFTLKSSLFEGRPPKSVNMYWRRFKTSDIPFDNDEQFNRWLVNRWREKDYLLEYYYKFGNFPSQDPAKALLSVEGKATPKHAKAISTSVKGGGWDEFLSIFGPVTTAAGALSSVDMTGPVNFDEIMLQFAQSQQFGSLLMGQAPKMPASQDAIRHALLAAHKQNPLPSSLMNQLLKAAPRTQAEMKQVLEKSGNAGVVKKATKAPGADKSISSETQKSLTDAAARTLQAMSKMPLPSTINATPADIVRKGAPLANLSTMITRPLTTTSLHAAASKVRDIAAERTRRTGTALPGQSAPNATKVAMKPTTSGKISKPVLTNGKAASVKASSVKAMSVSGVPKKAASVHGDVAVAMKKKVNGTIIAPTQKTQPGGAVVPSMAKKQATAKGSRPVGTQKYVNGKRV